MGAITLYVVSLQNKTAIITGAGQGIGKAIALCLAQAQCKGITIIDIRRDATCDETVKEIESLGAEVEFVVGDAASGETIKQAIQATLDRWGSLDILVNNAGIAYITDLFTTTEEQWDRVIRVNLRSTFLTMKYCGEVMKEQGFGSIINMSSIAGVTGGSTGPDYGASKAGVIGLTKFAAKALAPYGVRVNAVAPGTIATDMIKNTYSTLDEETVKKKLSNIPMRRMGEPDEVGKAVLFLASDLSSYVCGDVLLVTGARMS